MLTDGENAYVDNGNRDNRRSKGSILGTIFLLCLFFLPSVIVGYFVFALMRWWRLKPQVISLISLLMIITMIGWWSFRDYNQQLVDYFVFADNWSALLDLESWNALVDNWTYLIGPIFIVYAIIGVIGGLFSVLFQARTLRKRPEMREFKGHWMYHFEYRKSPLEVWRKHQRIKGLKNGRYRQEDRAPLGIDIKDDSLVSRYDAEAAQHALITGGTGSGKSITMLSMIKKDIEYQVPIIVVDLKRSPDLASKLAKWTHENDGDFYHFVNGDPESYDIPHSPGQAYYDPLRSGNNTSKADMVLGMREYDQASAVYKASMQRVLSVIFNFTSVVKKLRENGRTELCDGIDWDSGGVYLLSSAAKTDNFLELLNTCSNLDNQKIAGMAKDVLGEMNKRNSMVAHALGELQGQMQTILAGEYGDWLQTAPGERSIDLFKASKTPGSVVLFSLNSDDEKEFSRFIGSIIMADITRTSALRRNEDATNPVHIYIDEFQILVPDTVTDLLEKARASAMGVTLAQQSLSQVMKSVAGDGEAYLDSILDTCASFVFHAGAGYDTAEKMSKIVGKHDVETYSVNKRQDRYFFSLNWRNDREALASTRLEERWVIEPSRFQNLSSPTKKNGYKSTAIIIKKANADPRYKDETGSTVRETWMIPEQEILEKHYEPTNAQARRTYDERHGDIDDDDLAEIAAMSSTPTLMNDNDFMYDADEDDDDNGYTNPFVESTEANLLEIRKQEANQTSSKKRSAPKPSNDGFEQIAEDDVDLDNEDDDWNLEDLRDLAEHEEEPEPEPKPKRKKAPVKKKEAPSRDSDTPKRSRKKAPTSKGLPTPDNTDKKKGGGLPTMPSF